MNRHKPMFLFGSGMSPAPKVGELTDKILEADLYSQCGLLWAPIKPPFPQETAKAPRLIRRFLQTLRQRCAATWKFETKEVTYEQIAGLCRQLNFNSDTTRDPGIVPFAESIRQELSLNHEEFRSVPWFAGNWISSAIYFEFQRLSPDDVPTDNFVRHVIRCCPQATLVTLNHDTYLEDSFGPGLNLGFSETKFSPGTLSAPSLHKLLKLHGSVDWNSEVNITERRSEWRKTFPHSAPLIISGTISKLEDYNYLLFPWLWAEFQNSLRLTRRLVVCGYGFQDLGVNSRLTDWMRHYDDARILVLHPKPDDLLRAVSLNPLAGVQRFFELGPCADFDQSEALPPNARILFGKTWFEGASQSNWPGLIREFLET